MNICRNDSSAFTLIEMLVVIAIMSILSAMIMPALHRSIESTRRIVCINHQKQTGVMLATYASNYNEYTPVGYCNWTKQANYGFSSTLVNDFLIFGYLYRDNPDMDPQVLYCPSTTYSKAQFNSPDNKWPPFSGGWLRCGYVCSPVANWRSQSSRKPPPLSQVRYSSLARGNKAMLADWVSSRSWDYDQRHKDGVNVYYFDGSAHYVDGEYFEEYLYQMTGPSWVETNNFNYQKMWYVFDEQ